MKCSLPKETQLQAIYQRYFNYFSKAKPSIKSLSTLVTQSHEDGGKLKIYHEAYEGASETNNENTFLLRPCRNTKKTQEAY
ncbi:MAG: hypothetical protein HWD59_03770 [Coxiellaceae bacterium]|nr:MAG: hypothetical protein HWD59_03770 [Coxiellaceae bacterium]